LTHRPKDYGEVVGVHLVDGSLCGNALQVAKHLQQCRPMCLRQQRGEPLQLLSERFRIRDFCGFFWEHGWMREELIA